jgi:hypothetical protein
VGDFYETETDTAPSDKIVPMAVIPMRVFEVCTRGDIPVEKGIKFLEILLEDNRWLDNFDWVNNAGYVIRVLKAAYPHSEYSPHEILDLCDYGKMPVKVAIRALKARLEYLGKCEEKNNGLSEEYYNALYRVVHNAESALNELEATQTPPQLQKTPPPPPQQETPPQPQKTPPQQETPPQENKAPLPLPPVFEAALKAGLLDEKNFIGGKHQKKAGKTDPDLIKWIFDYSGYEDDLTADLYKQYIHTVCLPQTIGQYISRARTEAKQNEEKSPVNTKSIRNQYGKV